ncbi:MAG: hypothetical protein O9301_13645 [Leptospira sp.]|nr:hypothetical protein [Leptospira sp.]
MKTLLLTISLVCFLSFSFCKENTPDSKKEEPKESELKVEKVADYIDPNFSLKNYPEFNGIYEIVSGDRYSTLLEDYFSAELKKKGKKAASEIVSVGGGGRCTEFDFEKNLLRFRIRMEKYDLTLRFISKKGDTFYLTNYDQSRLVKLKVTEIYTKKTTNKVTVSFFKILSFHPERVIASGSNIDSENYQECVDFNDMVEESTRGMSKDDLGGPDGRDLK